MTGTLALIGSFVVMFGMMYLLVIRPQNKKEAKRVSLVASLEKGDRIRTFGGIVGNITAINDGSFVIRTAASEIEILKEAVAGKIEN